MEYTNILGVENPLSSSDSDFLTQWRVNYIRNIDAMQNKHIKRL